MSFPIFSSFFLSFSTLIFFPFIFISTCLYLHISFFQPFCFFLLYVFHLKPSTFIFQFFWVFFVKSEKVSLFPIFLDKRLGRTTFEHLLLLLANFGIRIPNYENVLMILLKRPCEADKSTNAVLENSYLN